MSKENFKLPQFLLCDSFFSDISEHTEFILHVRNPQFLAVVLNMSTAKQYLDCDHPDAEFVFSVEEFGIAEPHKLVPIQTYFEGEKNLKPYMKRMANWWHHYLSEELKLSKKNGFVLTPKDFTSKIPGLKVIDFKTNFMIIAKGQPYKCETESAAIHFLKELGITDEDLETGIINEFKFEAIGNN
jgi:hypothetical protein